MLEARLAPSYFFRHSLPCRWSTPKRLKTDGLAEKSRSGLGGLKPIGILFSKQSLTRLWRTR